MNKLYTIIVVIVLLSVSVLIINALIISYLLTYIPPLINIVGSVPPQVEHIVTDIEGFKKLADVINAKIDTLNKNFSIVFGR